MEIEKKKRIRKPTPIGFVHWNQRPENKEKRKNYLRGYLEKNRERLNEECREYSREKRSDPAYRDMVNELRKERYKAGGGYFYALYLRYNITREKYDELIVSQLGKCPGCGSQLREPEIDHDHGCCAGSKSCGVCVRGILCGDCNGSLGLIDDNIETMKNLVIYLQNN